MPDQEASNPGLVWRPWLVLALVATAGIGAWSAWRWIVPARDTTAPRGQEPVAVEPPVVRKAFISPFKNTAAGVRYVGDAACVECHAEVAQSYKQHPMGRALAPVAEATTPVHYDAQSHNPFVAQGFHYQVEKRGDRVFHRETRHDAEGRIIFEHEAEVHFALGSGTRGYSFLLKRENQLYQSPISWFTQQQRWDLAPGYEHRHNHFDRPISGQCLFCHCNRAEPVKDSFNRYEPPIFQGFAIGCERCHGPGELHVKARQVVNGVDLSIVNPKHLDPHLREGVCQQCHLQGESRVPRLGTELYDYRPGLPLHDYLSIFVKSAEMSDNYKAVSQVEQMHFSKCFKGSAGKLGCISCHDPHHRPTHEERIPFYRARCLECHGEKSCSVPEPVRLESNKADSCIDCHMPRGDAPDIAHTAMSDHRIPRRPDRRKPSGVGAVLRAGEMPFVHFHRDLVDSRDAGMGRDRGVALVMLSRGLQGNRAAKQLGGMALPRLDGALKTYPNDVLALESKAYALWVQERGEEAISVFRSVLALSPRREIALDELSLLLHQFGRRDEALALRRQALEINPAQARYHLELARLLADGGQWREALAAVHESLALNPALVEGRVLLVRAHLKLSERRQAREEFQKLLAFDPPNREEIERWFAEP